MKKSQDFFFGFVPSWRPGPNPCVFLWTLEHQRWLLLQNGPTWDPQSRVRFSINAAFFDSFSIHLPDLLNKRYDYKNELVVKDTAQNVEVEAAITQAHNSFNGKVKATQKHKGFEIEHAVSTNRNGPMFSSKLKTAKFYDGVTFLLGYVSTSFIIW